MEAVIPERSEVRIGCLNGRIVVLFAKPIDHLEMTKEEATQYIKILIEKVNQLTVQGGGARLIGVGS